jgi:hypothetical protein
MGSIANAIGIETGRLLFRAWAGSLTDVCCFALLRRYARERRETDVLLARENKRIVERLAATSSRERQELDGEVEEQRRQLAVLHEREKEAQATALQQENWKMLARLQVRVSHGRRLVREREREREREKEAQATALQQENWKMLARLQVRVSHGSPRVERRERGKAAHRRQSPLAELLFTSHL